jgi:hypothetical protein
MVVLEKLILSLTRSTNSGYKQSAIIEEILNRSTTLGNRNND